jgi:ABC-type Fe3+ transport system substrate-binding protein
MATRREFLKAGLGAGAIVLLAGCGGTAASTGPSSGSGVDADIQKAYDGYVKQYMPNVSIDLLKAAKAEGKVSLYHGQTGSDDASLAIFKQNFPFLPVETVALSGGNMIERFGSEYRAGKYLADLVAITSLPAAMGFQKEGFVMEYKIGPADEIAPTHQLPGYIYSQYSSVNAVGYNPTKMKDEDARLFQKWEGLLDPKWDGKKWAMNSDISGGALQVLYVFQYKTFGTALWEKMAKNVNLYPGSVPITDSIVSGETDIAGGSGADAFGAAYDKGAPVHWVYPEPVLAVPSVQFIASHAPHPNAAKVYQEFFFSVPSLSNYVQTGAMVDRKNVPDNRKVKSEPWFRPPDTTKLWPYTPEDITTGFPEAAKAWRSVFKA